VHYQTGHLQAHCLVLLDEQFPVQDGETSRAGMGRNLLRNLQFLKGGDALPISHIVGISSDLSTQAYLEEFPNGHYVGKDPQAIAGHVSGLLQLDFSTT